MEGVIEKDAPVGTDRPQNGQPQSPDFTAEHGPPLHPLPQVGERSINEKDCAVIAFVSPDVKGFQAIIKHRFSDFNVFEISADDTVVHLRSLEIPVEKKPDVVKEDFSKYTDLSADERVLFTALTWTRIVHLAKKYSGSGEKHSEAESVNIDVTGKDKEERKRIHDLIRTHFPHLSSDTRAKDDGGTQKSLLSVCYRTKKQRSEWPKDRPKYLQFTLYKEDMDQHLILSLLGRQLYSMKEKFSFAGTKDKRSRSSQKVTVPWVTPAKLTDAMSKIRIRGPGKVVLGDFQYVPAPLTLGKSNGNRFSIVLRNVVESDEVMDSALNGLREKGFVNYFGLQRFGTTAVKTSEIGLALIKQQWQKAVEMIMMPRSNERFFMKNAREFWWQYRDAERTLRMLGRKNEGLTEARLLFGLKVCGKNDLVGALNLVQKNVRLMYLHAYQSHVFNRVVSARVEKHGLNVLVGDLFVPSEIDADQTLVEETDPEAKIESNLPAVQKVSQETVDKVSIYDVVLPLPGHQICYPENDMKSLYEEVLAEDDLDLDSFKSPVPVYSLGGNYRHMLGKVADMHWSTVTYSDPDQDLVASDLDRVQGRTEVVLGEEAGQYKGVIVDFSLKSSQYATMALREALKVDTGRDSQSAMTEAHRAEFSRKRENETEQDEENSCKKAKSEANQERP